MNNEFLDEAIKAVQAMRPDLEGTIFGRYLATGIAMRFSIKETEPTRENVLRTYSGIPFIYGTYWKGRKRPRGVRKMKDKLCFENAYKLARKRPSLSYVEGTGISLIPCNHAWCMDSSGGLVDPTWRTPENSEYLGVALPLSKVADWTYRNGYYGIFSNLWLGKVEPQEIIDAIEKNKSRTPLPSPSLGAMS